MRTLLFIIALLSANAASAQRTFTLQQCIDSARQHNVALQNAALEIEKAGEQRKEAYTKYFPQISATVNAYHLFDELANTGVDRGYSGMVSASQPLYAGGQIVTANRMASVAGEIAVLQQSLKEQDVVQRVTENFWKIACLKYNLQTLAAAGKQVEAIHKRVSDFVETGAATRNALLRVRLRQQELESTRLKVENAQKVLLMLLAEQIGVDDRGFDIDTGSEMPADASSAGGSQSLDVALPSMADATSAAAGRTELLLAAKGIEAKQLQVRMERGKLLPTLALSVIGFQTHPFDVKMQGIDLPMRNGIALVSLSIPISQWWGGTHTVRRTKMSLQQARNDYDDARRRLRIDIEQAWSNLTEAYRQIGIARTSVEEAGENLRMASDQYTVGRTTITDLLEAETLNRQALDRLSTALADYHVRLADYQRKTNIQ